MSTYLDILPPDIQRLIQSYAEREVMIYVSPASINGFVFVISVAGWRLPFDDSVNSMSSFEDFVRGGSTLDNSIANAPLIVRKGGALVVTAEHPYVLYTFTDRQADILIKKLTRMHQDDVDGTLGSVY